MGRQLTQQQHRAHVVIAQPLCSPNSARLGVYSRSCISSLGPSLPNSTCQSCHGPTQGAWPCSSPSQHAGSHRPPGYPMQALCCHGTVLHPRHSEAGSQPGRWQQGGGQERSESSQLVLERVGGGIGRGGEGGLAGRPEMWSWLVFVELTHAAVPGWVFPRPGPTQARS